MSDIKVQEIQSSIHDAYQDILGRHADSDGLQAATKNIIDGSLTIERLRASLMTSDEYKKKNLHKLLSGEYKTRLTDKILDHLFVDYEAKKLF